MKINNTFTYILLILFLGVSCKNDIPNDKSNPEELAISDQMKWSDRMAQSIIKRAPEAHLNGQKPNKRWNYKVGLLMTSFEKLYEKTKNEAYFQYMKDFADFAIDENGAIRGYKMEDYNIDHINAGKFLFFMYEKTKDDRYLTAMKSLRQQLNGHPKTKSGGFWHKKIYPNQMWLDGLYMGSPYYARFNTTFENGDKVDDVIHQFDEIQKHTPDPKTGLLFHAWDASKKMGWANKETGQSPGFWSRSMGWYAMALVDVLDYIPQDHPGRANLISYLNELGNALVKFQDENTGLWWQVPDQPNRTGNYLEASSSCMFTYAFLKGVRKGYLPAKFKTTAEKTFKGITEELIAMDKDGEIHIKNVCSSAGLGGNPYRDGSYDYYISEAIKTDNLHGLGPFILAALEMGQ